MKLELLTKISVYKIEDPQASLAPIQDMMVEGEEVQGAFAHMRDKVWFTNKRIITMDVKVVTGNRREFRSFPYSKIASFSVETAGTLDSDSVLKIWTNGVGQFEIKFARKLDIKKVGHFVGQQILW